MNDRTAHLPWLTLIISLIVVAIHADGQSPALQLDRSTTWPNLWQLATCQFTHWSADHLRWDLLTFLALAAVCEWTGRRAFVRVLLCSSIVVPLAVLQLCPQITYFRGLSGIDSALFGLLMARLLIASWRGRDRVSLALMLCGGVLFLAKSLYETHTQDTVFVARGDTFTVVPIAHLAGFIVGIASALPLRACREGPSPTESRQKKPTTCLSRKADRRLLGARRY